MRFNYAIFDMDGLMFDTENLFIRSFTEYVEPKTGMSFPEDKLKQLIGLNRASTKVLFPELFGTRYTYEECFWLSDIWTKSYIEENGLPMKPGLIPLLSWLHNKKYRIAVASSTNREKVVRYLNMACLIDYFDVVMGGDMVTKGKPDPEIFLMTAMELGCELPSSCVVFEDSRNGLIAGKNAGMNVIVVPDLFDPTESLPEYAFAKVSRLDEAIPYLE